MGGGNVIYPKLYVSHESSPQTCYNLQAYKFPCENVYSYETKARAYCQTSLLNIGKEQLQTNVKQFKYTQEYDFFACDLI